jgi:hypothetical protein
VGGKEEQEHHSLSAGSDLPSAKVNSRGNGEFVSNFTAAEIVSQSKTRAGSAKNQPVRFVK